MKIKSLGMRLRELREGTGYTVESLAEATGFLPSSLLALERDIPQPALSILDTLSDVYNCSVIDLLDGGWTEIGDEGVDFEGWVLVWGPDEFNPDGLYDQARYEPQTGTEQRGWLSKTKGRYFGPGEITHWRLLPYRPY